jgi:hypothetical protein
MFIRSNRLYCAWISFMDKKLIVLPAYFPFQGKHISIEKCSRSPVWNLYEGSYLFNWFKTYRALYSTTCLWCITYGDLPIFFAWMRWIGMPWRAKHAWNVPTIRLYFSWRDIWETVIFCLFTWLGSRTVSFLVFPHFTLYEDKIRELRKGFPEPLRNCHKISITIAQNFLPNNNIKTEWQNLRDLQKPVHFENSVIL